MDREIRRARRWRWGTVISRGRWPADVGQRTRGIPATERNMKTIWNSKVIDSKHVMLEGRDRLSGRTVEKTVAELLEEVQDKSGVFGSDNQPVSGEMTLGDLANWHADYNWALAAR
jgi:hypothetical protein